MYRVMKTFEGNVTSVVELVEEAKTLQKYIRKTIAFTSPHIQHAFRHEIDMLQQIRMHCEPYFLCLDRFEETKSKGIMFFPYEEDTMDLFTYINNYFQQITPQEHMYIMEQLLHGLIHLHNLGFVHKDIKPENILIHRVTRHIRYLDFGFTCRGNDIACMRINQGTLQYASPEQYLVYKKKLNVDAVLRSFVQLKARDMFNLGLTFFYMVSKSHIPYKERLTTKDIESAMHAVEKRLYNGERLWAKPILLPLLRIPPHQRSLTNSLQSIHAIHVISTKPKKMKGPRRSHSTKIQKKEKSSDEMRRAVS